MCVCFPGMNSFNDVTTSLLTPTLSCTGWEEAVALPGAIVGAVLPPPQALGR